MNLTDTISAHRSDNISAQQRQQLRALNDEYKETTAAYSQAQHGLNRAVKVAEENYHRRRKAILSNGHGEDPQ